MEDVEYPKLSSPRWFNLVVWSFSIMSCSWILEDDNYQALL